MSPPPVLVAVMAGALGVGLVPTSTVTGIFRSALAGATGWPGLVAVAVYSFLIAFVLPGPSEVVLAAPLDLGVGPGAELAIVILVSGAAKAAGSVVAFRVGHEVRESGPVLRAFERVGLDVRAWSERRLLDLAERYGYVGLAAALSVPFFPDTLSIYAFSVLEEDYARFAAATFVGSVGRLLVTLFVVRGALLVV